MIPNEIRVEIGAELDRLFERGYRVAAASYSAESFGDWVVDLAGPSAFRIVKDRGQFYVDAERSSLEPHGLWRAYDDRAEFFRRLLAWAAR